MTGARGEWPLTLVDAVYVFGSYTRGALEPRDVDLAADMRRDERIVQHMTTCLFAGRTRGLQLVFVAVEREQLQREGVSMLRLWRCGDCLDQALKVLHGIARTHRPAGPHATT